MTYLSKTDVSSLHRQQKAVIERQLHITLDACHVKYPQHGKTWRNIAARWDGRVIPSTVAHVDYVPELGKLYVSESPEHKSYFAKCLCTLISRNTPGFCRDEILIAIEEARKRQFPIDIDCDDVLHFGLIATPFYDALYCSGSVNKGRMHEFPELTGMHVNQTMRILRESFPEATIKPQRWDLIGQGSTLADPNAILVTYDPVSRKTVYPNTRIQGAERPYSFTNKCFITAENGTCIPTPVSSQDLRDRFVGQPFATVFNSIRYLYPHSVVEMVYYKARISKDARNDRILLMVDDDMMIMDILIH